MAEFSKLVITVRGQALIAKILTGEGNVAFTKVSSSSAVYTIDQLEALEVLENVRQTSLVSRVTRSNDVSVKIETAFTNMGLSEGYYMRVLGLYAVDPDDGEILYAITTETTGNCYMPPYNGATSSGIYIQFVTAVGNAENVSLEVNQSAIATIKNIKELQEEIDALKTQTEHLTQNQMTMAYEPDEKMLVFSYGTVSGGEGTGSSAIPAASKTYPGVVKIGSGIDVDNDGMISVDIAKAVSNAAATDADTSAMLAEVLGN